MGSECSLVIFPYGCVGKYFTVCHAAKVFLSLRSAKLIPISVAVLLYTAEPSIVAGLKIDWLYIGIAGGTLICVVRAHHSDPAFHGFPVSSPVLDLRTAYADAVIKRICQMLSAESCVPKKMEYQDLQKCVLSADTWWTNQFYGSS